MPSPTITDGGATWKAQSSGTNSDLHAVSFTDAGNGTAVGGGPVLGSVAILRTTDGGVTWKAQSSRINGAFASLQGVTFTDANTGTAVGGSCITGGACVAAILDTTYGGEPATSKTRSDADRRN